MQKDKRNRVSNYHVIANQCAHWCGNPFLFTAFSMLNCGMGMRFDTSAHKGPPRNDMVVGSHCSCFTANFFVR